MNKIFLAAAALAVVWPTLHGPVLAEPAINRLLGGDSRGEGSGSSREQREDTADDCARLRHEAREIEERLHYDRERDYRNEHEQYERELRSVHQQLDHSCRR